MSLESATDKENTEVLLIRALGKKCISSLPLGIMSIHSYLKKYGYESIIFDRYIDPDIKNLKRLIEDLKNLKVIGISAITIQIKDAIQTIKQIRKTTKAKIILGGTHATALPKQLAKYVDHIIIGEGEIVFKEIVQGKHQSKKIIKGKFVRDLNEIPLMNAKEIKEQGIMKKGGEYYLATSRGCPYNCNFCLSKEQRIPGIRYINIDTIISHIKDITKNLNVKKIMIPDDIFVLNKERVKDFCKKVIKQKIKVKFSCFTHAGHGNEKLYNLMKKAGFYRISIGVEHGTNELLEYCGKRTTLDKIEETCSQIHNARIKIGATYILGNIPETNETITATVNFAIKLHKKYGAESWFSFAQPLPGSPMFKEAQHNGTIIEKDYSKWNQNSLVYVPKNVDINHMIKEKKRGMKRANKLDYNKIIRNMLYKFKLKISGLR